jgi:chitinase
LSSDLSNRELFKDLVLCSFDVESCSYNYRNFNYGAASASVGYNILANPNEVSSDPVLAFKTAGREPGFGETINIINGGECDQTSAAASNRITYYQNFCSQLGVSPGSNLSCASAQPY